MPLYTQTVLEGWMELGAYILKVLLYNTKCKANLYDILDKIPEEYERN